MCEGNTLEAPEGFVLIILHNIQPENILTFFLDRYRNPPVIKIRTSPKESSSYKFVYQGHNIWANVVVQVRKLTSI